MSYVKAFLLSISVLAISTLSFLIVNGFEERVHASQHMWTWWLFLVVMLTSLFSTIMLPVIRLIAHLFGHGKKGMVAKSINEAQVSDPWHGMNKPS